MILLTKPAAIRKTLRAIKPRRIAVAYVGDQREDSDPARQGKGHR